MHHAEGRARRQERPPSGVEVSMHEYFIFAHAFVLLVVKVSLCCEVFHRELLASAGALQFSLQLEGFSRTWKPLEDQGLCPRLQAAHKRGQALVHLYCRHLLAWHVFLRGQGECIQPAHPRHPSRPGEIRFVVGWPCHTRTTVMLLHA